MQLAGVSKVTRPNSEPCHISPIGPTISGTKKGPLLFHVPSFQMQAQRVLRECQNGLQPQQLHPGFEHRRRGRLGALRLCLRWRGLSCCLGHLVGCEVLHVSLLFYFWAGKGVFVPSFFLAGGGGGWNLGGWGMGRVGHGGGWGMAHSKYGMSNALQAWPNAKRCLVCGRFNSASCANAGQGMAPHPQIESM